MPTLLRILLINGYVFLLNAFSVSTEKIIFPNSEQAILRTCVFYFVMFVYSVC